jgi:hypothetical protein
MINKLIVSHNGKQNEYLINTGLDPDVLDWVIEKHILVYHPSDAHIDIIENITPKELL